jgi:hypothetical protein
MNRCATEEYTHHYVRSRLPFDPTYGYNKAQLQEIRPPADVPHDFEAFWRATFSESSAVPLRLEVEPVESLSAGWTMNVMRYNTLNEVRVGAWVLAPADASRIRRGFVVGHGYGGRSAPQWPLSFDDAAYIFRVRPASICRYRQAFPTMQRSMSCSALCHGKHTFCAPAWRRYGRRRQFSANCIPPWRRTSIIRAKVLVADWAR